MLWLALKKNREPESGIQINDTPIIETAKKQHISLNVGSFLEKGKYYTFYYYKNSRIAKAVEKKSNKNRPPKPTITNRIKRLFIMLW